MEDTQNSLLVVELSHEPMSEEEFDSNHGSCRLINDALDVQKHIYSRSA